MGFGLRRFNRDTMSMDIVKWHIGYVDEIENMIIAHERECEKSDKNKMLILLISTHDDVRHELSVRGLNYTIVVPGKSNECKHAYLERLQTRYNFDKTPANQRAYETMAENYDKFVSAIVDQVPPAGCNGVVVLAKNETLTDFMRQVNANSIFDSLFGISGLKSTSPISSLNFHQTTGANGELIMYSDPIDPETCVIVDETGDRKIDCKALDSIIYNYTRAAGWQSAASAFAACPFITISKEDAQRVIDAIKRAIDMIHDLSHNNLIVPEDLFDDSTLKAYYALKNGLDGINHPYELRDIEHAKKKEEEEARRKCVDKYMTTHRNDLIVEDRIAGTVVNGLNRDFGTIPNPLTIRNTQISAGFEE